MFQVGSSGGGGLDFGEIGSGISGLAGGIGSLFEASGYAQAASIAKQNAAITKLSTDIQQTQTARQAFQVMGSQQANVASAGFSEGGSALDLLKSSAQQASLQKGLVAYQGLINQNAWLEKAAADQGMANAATAGGIGGIISSGLQIAVAAGAF